MASETPRQIVHIAMSAFALLLRVLTWWQAALCAVAAVLFNVVVLPRIGGRSLSRPADLARGYPLGIVIYPIAVLVLILAFPARLDIVAAAWGIMAFGDGAATLAGRRWGRHRLAWNPLKTAQGLTAFIVAGGAAGVALAWWVAPAVTPRPGILFLLLAPLSAALAAGLAETIPIALDDNVTVPAVAGAVLGLCSLASAAAWDTGRSAIAANLAPALAVNTVAALAGWRLGTVRLSGMLTGWAIGVIVYSSLGLRGWVLLFATFGLAAVTSRLGLGRKTLLGIQEERGGRRGGGSAFANTGLAAVAALVAAVTPFREAALLAFVAALATGGGDTTASEIGKAFGGRTYVPARLTQARPGTPGAVSLEGSVGGVIGALVLAAAGAWLGLIPWWAVWAALAGAVAGSMVESALASTLEASNVVNNDVLNFINTATGAAVALIVARLS